MLFFHNSFANSLLNRFTTHKQLPPFASGDVFLFFLEFPLQVHFSPIHDRYHTVPHKGSIRVVLVARLTVPSLNIKCLPQATFTKALNPQKSSPSKVSAPVFFHTMYKHVSYYSACPYLLHIQMAYICSQ